MDSRVSELHSCASSLVAKFKQGGGVCYINEAINLDREALELCSPPHALQCVSMGQLASHLCDRYCQLGNIGDLNEAIVFSRDALAVCPLEHPNRSSFLNNLALHLSTRYSQLGGIDDLSEAIALDREVLALRPQGHPNRSMALNNLAADLTTRYNQLGNMEDLNEAIVLARDALMLRPPGHPDRSMSLNNLAIHLSTRYSQLGEVEDLNEAIVLDRDALALRPPGHPDRLSSLNNLANHLAIRCDQFWGAEDLNEAIVLVRNALAICPPGHPDRSTFLHNLALYLSARYTQLGGIDDLNEAILLDRDALALRPRGHPDRPMTLNNLAGDLSTRYNILEGQEDLNEAIVLDREALVLRPPGHPDRVMSLNNLAVHLITRYEQLKHLEDLNEALFLDQDALALCPPGNPARPKSLNNLANCLAVRYKQLRSLEDLDRAIVLSRDALALRPPGHPDHSMSLNNLAVHLSTRHDQLGGTEDLDDAINLTRNAVLLYSLGHPDWSTSLLNLTRALHTRFACSSRLEDKEEMFNGYSKLADAPQAVSSSDLSAGRAWIKAAEKFHHPTTLIAYQTTLQLLVRHLAGLPSLPQHLPILRKLTSSLAPDAFSACLRNRSPVGAVELLEQGRGVFWSQLARLQSPLDDLTATGTEGKTLAKEFKRLTSLIHKAFSSPGADQHNQVCHLNVQLQQVVHKIRDLPGLSRFLLPSLFSDFRHAASGGPVIIVNASKYSCDALVILADQEPVHIPLSVTQEDVRALMTRLRTLLVRAKSMYVSKDLGWFLRDVWKIISPIIHFLQTVHQLQSRIWWCPTAEFSVLPLHAAGPYRKGQRNLPDMYISSYTPTLAALVRARRPDPSIPETRMKRFLAVGQATATGQSELPSVGTELASIGQIVEGSANFTRIEGEESNISRVAEELGRNEWVHLACHGIANRKQPFESAFALRDGRFTVQRIIQCELTNPELAYLSACHTTVGDAESPDEVIHLAAAMQFAGFRSVIGTMWAVDDAHTNEITSMFYKHMVNDSGYLDHTRAAFALRETIKKLKHIPFDQRVLYIHIGA